MKPVILTETARADLCSIDDLTLARFGLDQCVRITAQFRDAFDKLAEHPESGHRRSDLAPRGSDLRFVTVSKAFLLVYVAGPDRVDVVRVFHGAQDVKSELTWPPV